MAKSLRPLGIALALFILLSASLSITIPSQPALAAVEKQDTPCQIVLAAPQDEGTQQLELEKGGLEQELPIMRPSPETRQKWIEKYNKAPKAHINEKIKLELEQTPVGGSLSLLDYLQYTPSQRSQGGCGNCWAWAGTGVMEIALDVQNGIKDRLSIQYLNSNYNGGSGTDWACCGGWIDDVASFYTSTGRAIPWSNTNASYQDGSRTCGSGSTSVPAGNIDTSYYYAINSITTQSITTQGISQATAIANIKNILNQNKAVWFGFFLPTAADWNNFGNFWYYQPETAIWDPDFSCGHAWDAGGGGHAVLCVGYNDDDPNPANRYWLMVNSWGTAGGNRPNGLFRLAMDMNYSCQDSVGGYAFYWQTLNTTFQNPAPGNFTIVALPDTQHYSAFYPQTFTTQTQWIKDNETSKNIVFVTHEGDIVDTNSNMGQWANANTAMSLLDGQVPYGIAPGNHDGAPSETANFNTYFPYTRYSSQSWYGGHYGTDNDNSYQLFSAGGQHFIILHIEYGADSNVLSWADGILKAYPTYMAIVTSHYLLNADGSFGTYGSNIYNALKGNSNLFLMLCGHIHGEASRMDTYNGNTVYTLLADYQERSNGGDGWLRVMEFSPTTNSISVKTYSPTLNQYEMDADSQFEVSYTSQKLMGHDDASFSGYGASNYISITKYTASTIGTLTEFRIKCNGSGHVKIAMYDDSGGNPGDLLNSVGSTSVVSGWNTISLPSSTSVTKDTAYWLACISDTSNICGWVTGPEPKRWKAWPFSSDFPNPAGSGYTSGNGGDLVAGWGTITPPAPPVAPTVINSSSGASNIASTSARLNGEITDTGNENPFVTIYWGTTDGGTTPGSWTNNVNIGTKGLGTFYNDITNLTPDTDYYYRCYASNSAGFDWANSTSHFKTQIQTQKLMGHDDASFSGYGASNYISITKYTASTTGTLTEFRIKCNGSGHVKVAMYADSGGNPGDLLNSVGSTAVVSGWNTISLPSSISITEGTAYWLAYVGDTNNICGWVTGPEPKQYKAWAFSNDFPNPAGSGYTSGTGGDPVAGWGTITPPAPPVVPTVINSFSGASNIASTSARLNGEITDTGNENPSVTIYWGTTDGGTTPGSWTNNVNIGTKGLGTFYTDITSLTPDTDYYYTCYAQNSAGSMWASPSSQFKTTIQTLKLIGHDDAAFSGYGASNYISITKYTASTTGTISEFRIKCSGSGHVKVAMYADSGGNPGDLLNSVGSTAVVSGWNTISLPSSISITEGTAYWLAYVGDTNNICGWVTGPEPKQYKAWAFSNDFPNPAGSGYTSGTGGDPVAGWGTTTPPSPPNPPAPLSPGTTITFKWGAADRATEYYLQVSTSASFATTVFDAKVGNNTSQEVTGLSLGTPYYWRVKAGNAVGWSDWSATRSVTVTQIVP